MKKVLSIVLSMCLLVTSMSAVLTQSVSADTTKTEVVFDENTIFGTPVEDVSTFYNAANWYYSTDTTLCMFDESARKDGKASEITDGSVDYDGDGKAIAIDNPYAAQVYIPFKVEKNTSYRFSFYIKGSVAGSFSSGSGIANSTFTATGTPNNALNGSAGMHELLCSSNSSTSPTGLAGNYAITPRKAGNYQLSTDNWVEISYTFNSQDNEDFYYFFRGSTKATYYLDGFKLLKDYYNPEDVLFWSTYRYNDATYSAVIGSPTGYGALKSLAANSTGSGGSIGYCNAADYFNDTDNDNGYSIKTYSTNRHIALSLPVLKANTKYRLSYNYATYNCSANSIMYTRLLTKGTTLTAASTFSPEPVVTGSNVTLSSTTNATFSAYTLDFETDGENYDKLYLAVLSNVTNTFYDNFKLEEILKTKVTVYDGDTLLDTLEGYEGEALTIAEPTKDGYTFAGWYTDAELTTPFTAETFPAADTTLYAKWEKVDTFEILTNWGTYSNNAVVDGSIVAPNTGFTSVTENTTYTSTGNGKSIKVNGNITHSAVAISGLKAYTSYTLTFKYMIPSGTTQSGTNPWLYFNIVKKGTTAVGNMQSDIAYHTTSNEALNDGTWHEVTLNFTTDATTDYFFTSYGRFGGGYNYYLDEFVLTQGETYTPVTITFNTNGGDAIEPLDTKAGEAVTVPDATKTDKVFAGWYTDAELTTAFDGVALDSDFTLYADWADYKVTKNNSGILIKEFKDSPVHEWASYGDIVTVSFDYRLVSGDAAFYPITSSSDVSFNQAKWYYDNNGTVASKTAVNGFTYNSEDVNEGSKAWQTYSATHSLRDATNIAGQYSDEALSTPITVEDFLGYATLFFTKGGDTKSTDDLELYISNVKFETTGKTNSLDAGWESRAAICAAENSTTGKNGLRVKNLINTAWFEDVDVVEYGSIVTYKTLLGDETLTLDFDSSKYVKGVAYSEADGISKKIFEQTTTGDIHTSYLINIPDTNFAEDVVIRTYAIDRNGKVYYDNGAFELCVYDMLNAMDLGNTADGSEPTQTDIDTFAYFVTEAVADSYKAWCEENGETTGDLFAGLYN